MNITSVTKKLATALAAVAAIAFAATPSHAAFASVSKSTVTASALVGGVPTITINSVIVKKIADDSVVANNTIDWVGVNAGDGFKLSDAYIQLKSSVTTLGAGVQIYTDNTEAGASPKFLADPTTLPPAGLVASDGSSSLPMGWSVKLATTTVTAIDPNTDPAFSWSFFEDAGQQPIVGTSIQPWTSARGSTYVTVKNPLGVQTNNTHFFGGGMATGYIYTEADFGTASPGVTYGTNRIILEAFTQ